jgi:hypothetical protein
MPVAKTVLLCKLHRRRERIFTENIKDKSKRVYSDTWTAGDVESRPAWEVSDIRSAEHPMYFRFTAWPPVIRKLSHVRPFCGLWIIVKASALPLLIGRIMKAYPACFLNGGSCHRIRPQWHGVRSGSPRTRPLVEKHASWFVTPSWNMG